MAAHRIVALVHLLRQGLALEGEFGLLPLEAMVAVARTVEESVFDPASFVRGPVGLRFVLRNPPLRCGAFSAIRVGVDGAVPTAKGLRVATGTTSAWTEAVDLSATHPLHLRPGVPIRFDVESGGAPGRRARTVRIELDSVAIPPLVWLEFTAVPRDGPLPT